MQKVGIALVVLLSAAQAFAATNYRAGELIVKYKDGAARSRITMNALYDAAGVKKVKRFGKLMKGFEHLVLSEDVKMEDALAALNKSELVEYAEPNYLIQVNPVRTSDDQTPAGFPCIPGIELPGCDKDAKMPCIPGLPLPGCDPNAKLPCIPGLPLPGCEDPGNPGNPGNPEPPATRPDLQPAPPEVNPPVADPDLDQAYGLGTIGAREAWKTFPGTKEFVVADIDTGIDYNHEDLAFNVWRNPNPSAKNDVVGYDFVHDDGVPFDDQGHGTHTAGTIGAVGGNGKGVSGVASRISVMSVKFLNSQGSGDLAAAIKAIDYAVEHGARVLSNSWGGRFGSSDGGESKSLSDAIERAGKKGALFVAAAGNESSNNDDPSKASYPAAYQLDNIIAVAATDNTDQMAYFSNYGKKTVHLSAPGVNVYSTLPGNQYKKENGTSMACPHVSGAAALLWARHPEWDYKRVKDVLLKTVDKIQSLDAKTITGGRLNILTALRSTE